MERVAIQPPGAPRLRGFASQAVKVTGGQTLVFCAGQVAFDENRNVVGRGDMRAQTRQALANLEQVLRAAGGDLSNVVKMTTFITDFGQIEAILAARAEFPLRDFASSTVQVSGLVHSDLMIEIEALAILG